MVLPASRDKLTAGEIGVLWGTYIYASINDCMLWFLHAKAKEGMNIAVANNGWRNRHR